ncbi:MAG: carbon starvation protein A [Paludibacteraceae bacterium]|nr:carbon starvation protein A [Paludibacteraceae bacterium]
MITFCTALAMLVLGYCIYGSFVERVFGADSSKKTPAYTMEDGVDYVPMPTWRVYLIQFLNIAGTGPIFGAIQGVLFGPAAYFWIVLGCIFGGATHDYLAGMISLRKNGASLPEIVGDQLGSSGRFAMRALSLVLMVMVGAVFVTTPSALLSNLTGYESASGDFYLSASFFAVIIFIYYILATLLPVSTLIGRIYPIFGVALLFMAAGVAFGVFTQNGGMPEITDAFANHHPKQLPLFPMLFITIACGAVSGFHATQSPMMARCQKNEKHGRIVFYGAMITEGVVALIWAAAAMKFADTLGTDGATPYEKLANFMAQNNNNPAAVVNAICQNWLGSVGAVLAVLGVVAAPITSGDTALRAARLIAADFLHVEQKTIVKRLMVAAPIFVLSAVIMNMDFSILWRYFAWLNQTLSIFTFWTITVWLFKNGKPYIITLIPALFMTCVCTTYIMISPKEGLAVLFPGVEAWPIISYAVGIVVPLVFLCMFVKFMKNYKPELKA